MLNHIVRPRNIILLVILLILVGLIAWYISIKPSNDRNWAGDAALLPYADINKNVITVHNVRNFTYKSGAGEDYTPGYYDKTYDLAKIKKVYYVVEPFSEYQGPAHTFVTFEFEDNVFVSISIEIRKQKGDDFNELRSAFKGYELMYVIGDEKDVIKLRTNYRMAKVYLYPIKADKGAIAFLFKDMVERANQLRLHPEFYNLFTSTCTTNLVDHVNKIAPQKIPYDYRILLPAYSDLEAYQYGWIDTNLSFEDARQHFYISDLARKYADDPDFSLKIRQGMSQ